ncbi:hypothetical protein PVAP13_9NG430214 [Panicum virgatum]|uniref:Uncharacterized protein n=1 Tax=Panicum virgatum TaxID=38727 RepID=A0A8T0MUG9_PANVG|nr:hypothetical protein PVAP13_9NG430214 [Panicum virgatum]
MSGTEGESPTDFNECVSKNELQRLIDDQRTYIDGKFDELMRTINGLVTRVEHVEQHPPPRRHRCQPYGDADDEDEDANLDADARDVDHLRCNCQGMGGNQNRGNNDPFAKPNLP